MYFYNSLANLRIKIVSSTWRCLRELPRCVCLHLKTDLLLSENENIIPESLGINAVFLEFSASLSLIYPPGKSEIIEVVQYFASSCKSKSKPWERFLLI